MCVILSGSYDSHTSRRSRSNCCFIFEALERPFSRNDTCINEMSMLVTEHMHLAVSHSEGANCLDETGGIFSAVSSLGFRVT